MRGTFQQPRAFLTCQGTQIPTRKQLPFPLACIPGHGAIPIPIPSPNQILCCGAWLPQNTVAPYPCPGPWLRISHFGKVPDTQCRACASVQPALGLSVGPAASPERAPSRPARAAPGAARPRRAPHLSSDPSAPGSPAAHGTCCSSRYALADGLNPHAAAAAGGRPGGSATARPRQAPGGKAAAGRGRHRRRAPPSHPRGAGRAAPPHPGPHRGGYRAAAAGTRPTWRRRERRSRRGRRARAGPAAPLAGKRAGGSKLASPGAPQPGGAGSVPSSPAAAARGCAVRHLPGGSTPAKGTRCGSGAAGASSFCCRK